MTYHHIDEAISTLARRQHGAFSRRQALAVGATSHIIRARVRSGQWKRIASGVYVLPSHQNTWQQRLMAATLGSNDAVAAGKSAAVLYGLEGFRPGALEIAVPRGSHHRSELAIVHETDVTRALRRDGIPVADPVKTWFDLVGRVPPTVAEVALEDGLRQKLFDVPALTNHLVKIASSRRPGIAVARALLETLDDGYVASASELERLLYGTFDIPEFQPFVRQMLLPWRPRGRERLDGFLTTGSIIAEADGRSWHGQLRAMNNDRRRDRDAIVHGCLPLRWTWVDLRDHRDEARDTVRRVQARSRSA